MRHPDYDNALEALKACQSETVPASMIAPILNMNPSVIIKYAKDGTWNTDKWGNFVISGDRVKFFRRDFLHKCGLMDPEPEKPTVEQLLDELIETCEVIAKFLLIMMDPLKRTTAEKLIDELAEQARRKKTASAATLTE